MLWTRFYRITFFYYTFYEKFYENAQMYASDLVRFTDFRKYAAHSSIASCETILEQRPLLLYKSSRQGRLSDSLPAISADWLMKKKYDLWMNNSAPVTLPVSYWRYFSAFFGNKEKRWHILSRISSLESPSSWYTRTTSRMPLSMPSSIPSL